VPSRRLNRLPGNVIFNLMNRTIKFISLFLFLPGVLFGQSKEILKDLKLTREMDRLILEKKFDSVIILGKKIPERKYLYLYNIDSRLATAYFEKGNTTIGLQYLEKAIGHQDYSEEGNVRYSLKKYHLDSNKQYKGILRNFDNLHNRYTKNLDLPVLKECLEIFYTDQRIRNLWVNEKDSNIRKQIDLVMWKSDSINAENMKGLLRKLGHYPGISEIGISFSAFFNYSVTHFASILDQDTLYSYMKLATLKGQLPSWYGPRMLDKLQYDMGQPLIFGEFGNANFYNDEGTYIYPEIKDVEYVDERRGAFLLEPLYIVAEKQKSILPNKYDRKTQKKKEN
jgi:hypothetical protein